MIVNIVKYLAIGIIILVSNIFKLLNLRSCRFSPSCSEYAIDAFKKCGIGHATYLTIKRLLRCHPLSSGGYDPIERSLKKV